MLLQLNSICAHYTHTVDPNSIFEANSIIESDKDVTEDNKGEKNMKVDHFPRKPNNLFTTVAAKEQLYFCVCFDNIVFCKSFIHHGIASIRTRNAECLYA